MNVQKFDPLRDPRWPRLLARHSDASVFHSTEWLHALHLTYGYQPVGFTTSEGDDLSNGVVFCEIESWITGRRLVSLPFSDHCQPLAVGNELTSILEYIRGERRNRHWRYIELRPVTFSSAIESLPGLANSESFSFHKIDLRFEQETIFRAFHESCVRRKIKRAARENLVYEVGRSEGVLQKFLQLLLLTRRRHKLPPQPASWFRNILSCLGEMVTIHVLSKDGMPVASIMTLSYKETIVYKYGCSDAKFNSLGGTPLLFWKVIQQSKEVGAVEFDLGRSGYEDTGLITFKEHLGAASSELRYYRDPASRTNPKSLTVGTTAWARQALTKLPDSFLIEAGRMLYRHLG